MPTAHLNGSLADAIILRRVYLMSLYHRFRWNILINECQVVQIYAADNVTTLNIEGVTVSMHSLMPMQTDFVIILFVWRSKAWYNHQSKPLLFFSGWMSNWSIKSHLCGWLYLQQWNICVGETVRMMHVKKYMCVILCNLCSSAKHLKA